MSELSVQLYSVRDAFAAAPADTLRRLAALGFTNVEPYGVLENVEALRAGLPANGLAAPTAHARLIGADQAAVFAAAADVPRTAREVYDCLGCSAECGRCARTIKRIMTEALDACAQACSGVCQHRPGAMDGHQFVTSDAR